jgi:hypothetical protein
MRGWRGSWVRRHYTILRWTTSMSTRVARMLPQATQAMRPRRRRHRSGAGRRFRSQVAGWNVMEGGDLREGVLEVKGGRSLRCVTVGEWGASCAEGAGDGYGRKDTHEHGCCGGQSFLFCICACHARASQVPVVEHDGWTSKHRNTDCNNIAGLASN